MRIGLYVGRRVRHSSLVDKQRNLIGNNLERKLGSRPIDPIIFCHVVLVASVNIQVTNKMTLVVS
jgi:hypothetical protein